MPINPMQFEIQKSPFGQGMEQGSATQLNLANALLAHMKAQKTDPNSPQSLADLIHTRLTNTGQENINKYYGQNIQSEIGLRGAQAGNLNADAAKTDFILRNPGLMGSDFAKDAAITNYINRNPKVIQNAVEENQTPQPVVSQQTREISGMPGSSVNPNPAYTPWNAAAQMAVPPPQQQEVPGKIAQGIAGNAGAPFDQSATMQKYLNSEIQAKQNQGMYSGGVSIAQQRQLIADVKRDNSGFTDDQVYEAAGNLTNGQTTLNDGTPINASGLTQANASKVALQSTTSPLATQAVKSKQAEAELGVLNDYAQKGLAPYGDSIMNMSGPQIVDTFKSDKESQLRLGKLIGSQALQYEAAQQRIRLANGQPGVTSTEELMKLSGQMINTKFPKLSYEARREAARYLDEALKAGLAARQKVGVGINTANQPNAYGIPGATQVDEPGTTLDTKKDTNGKYDFSNYSDADLANLKKGFSS